MKSLSLATLAHLEGETTTFASCWKLTRKDSVVMGFTSNVRDLVIDGVTYKAKTGAYATNVETEAGRGVDSSSVMGLLNSDDITEADLLAGVYDDARVVLFLVNYEDLTQDPIIQLSGFIGEVKTGRVRFEAEVRGLLQRATQTVGIVTSPECRATLGDSACGKNLSAFTFNGTVNSSASNGSFTTTTSAVVAKAAAWFAYGTVTFTSGANEGATVGVRNNSAGSPMTITLVESLPYPIEAGDLFTIVTGCDGLPETCKTKFSNILRFRGEPFVPGADAVLRVIR